MSGERESDLGRRGEPRVIVDGPPPRAFDGAAWSGHETTG